MANTCKFCNETFESRNAVFRHLRSNQNCFQQATQSSQDGGNALKFLEKLEKRKVAIRFGYYASSSSSSEDSTQHVDGCEGANELAAAIVCQSFFKVLKNIYPSSPVVREAGDDGNPVYTLTSVATTRHPSLMQEKACSAAADVVGISYEGGPSTGIADTEFLIDQLQTLVDEVTAEGEHTESFLCIKILGAEILAASSEFHAETSCTQRAYQYLIPIHWIDDSKETREWAHSKCLKSTGEQTKPRTYNTPLSILRFKKMLKIIESRDVTQIQSTSESIVSSAGRYGCLWKKERRPFHNFCDPSLGSGSMASPSNENVWRSLDKCRLSGFIVDKENGNEPIVVLEIRGDGFVAQQVRRIVATVIAMTNKWLPADFFASATCSDATIETPIAPADLLYCGCAQFHFIDQSLPSPLFHNKFVTDRCSSWLASLQFKLLQRRARSLGKEASWLQELMEVTIPRIRSSLKGQIKHGKQNHSRDDGKGEPIEILSGLQIAPEPYRKTLSLLHDICGNKKWPRTSDGRSRVIRSPGLHLIDNYRNTLSNLKSRPVSSKFQGQQFQCGTFTLANPTRIRGKIPATNEQFPELAEAVFELEAYCMSKAKLNTWAKDSEKREHSASTHCIVNRDVEFTPHFLPGKGKEGCYSIIVGLGDYTGGEFIVNGRPFHVRYEPLRYNGYKQITSTKRFRGERFSLVWFTPDRREDSMRCGSMSYEDSRAKSLSEKHNVLLPSYPELSFRLKSTDSLVINEILDSVKGCDYEMPETEWSNRTGKKDNPGKTQNGFCLEGHEVVLDIGAHIGVFSRYALSVGCKRIIAYEPELENARLLEQNLQPNSECGAESHTIRKCAVAHGEPGVCNFVNARNRTDGTLNSWRHSLEKYSTYVDRKGDNVISSEQEAILARSRVETIPFFGDGGALCPGITFVKMDCEGAEIDILLSTDASHSCKWLDVTHLVFEWSFTKERRVAKFKEAVENLNSAGFDIVHDGQGSWWDTEPNCMWPYHTDLVVFARKRNV